MDLPRATMDVQKFAAHRLRLSSPPWSFLLQRFTEQRCIKRKKARVHGKDEGTLEKVKLHRKTDAFLAVPEGFCFP